MEPFSIREAIGFGWKETRAHSGLFFGAVLIIVALGIVRGFALASSHHVLGIVISSAAAVLELIVGIGALAVSLRIERGGTPVFSDLIPPWRVLWRYVLVSLVATFLALFFGGIPVLFGVLLLIPHNALARLAGLLLIAVGIAAALYVGLRYSMACYASLDGRGTVASLLRTSVELTRGVKGKLFLFMLTLIGFNLLGFLALFVGLLITIPMSWLASIRVYLALTARGVVGAKQK